MVTLQLMVSLQTLVTTIETLLHSQSNSRSHLTMTGDPTVDSDIADFIAARQRVLQNRQKFLLYSLKSVAYLGA